jgi:hypothetical protein
MPKVLLRREQREGESVMADKWIEDLALRHEMGGSAENEAAMWKQKFEETQKQEPDVSAGNSFSQNKAIRAKFPDPDEAAAYMEAEFLSPSIGPHGTMRQIRARMRAFQRDTINTLADCLVREAGRLEAINGFVTIEDLKRQAQALRDYADTLAPAAPEATR